MVDKQPDGVLRPSVKVALVLSAGNLVVVALDILREVVTAPQMLHTLFLNGMVVLICLAAWRRDYVKAGWSCNHGSCHCFNGPKNTKCWCCSFPRTP